MSRTRSAVVTAVAAMSMLAGALPAPAWSVPVAGSPPSRARSAPQPPVPDLSETTLPDLTSVSPLDEGQAAPPPQPVESTPEQGDSRLGAAAVTLAPLTFSFKANAYGIYNLPRDRFPYVRATPTALVDSGVHDAAGVRMRRIGNRLYDHPVGQAGYGIDNVESFVLNGDQRYLNRAKAQAGRLIARAKKVGTAWYLPYPFDFHLHGRANERMAAPWYSAMAQGQAMTLFVRLYEITNNVTYRNAADGVFASFLRPRGAATPWVVWVDKYKRLWLEEYPGASPDRTLNGHLFATFGMWDYWRLTQDARAKTLYQGALTTAADYFTAYRNANWLSQYCLSHPTVLSYVYHPIHLRQFFRIFAISRGLAFLRLAETLSADYPPPTVKGQVVFAAGTHQGVKFTGAGKVAARKTLRLTRSSFASADRRERVHGQPGLWYRITAGALAGHYVREKYAVSAMRGRSLTYRHYPARRVTMAANKQFTGYEFDNLGKVLSRVSVVTTEATPFGTIASAVWNGREYLLAETGPLAGRWIQRGTLIV
jgi:hypothetical protein